MAGVADVPVDAVIVPGFATLIEPPVAKEGFARVFADGAWSEIEDHRGKTFWTAEGAEQTITELGPLPDGLLTEKPVLPGLPGI